MNILCKVLVFAVLMVGALALEEPECNPEEAALYQELYDKCTKDPQDPNIPCSKKELEILEQLEVKCGGDGSYEIDSPPEGNEEENDDLEISPRFKRRRRGRGKGKGKGKLISVNGQDNENITNSNGNLIGVGDTNVAPNGVVPSKGKSSNGGQGGLLGVNGKDDKKIADSNAKLIGLNETNVATANGVVPAVTGSG